MKDKNRYGQYFTEGIVADFMVSLISKENTSAVLEPSCGKGIFLEKLENNGFNNISAYEIDKTLDIKFRYVKYESFISAPLEDKFDVIIGNPPYIRWKNLESELKKELSENTLWNKYFNSLCDYLFIFILKCIEQLNEGGELIFICSDYWLNTTHSQTLRNYMCTNGYFESIYHFKEAPLFEKVSASLIIFKYIKSKNTKQTIKLFTYNKKGKPEREELFSGSCFNVTEIPQFKQNQRWILASADFQKQLFDFENACIKQKSLFYDKTLNKIGDFCDIGNGMVSGLDAAFKINAEDEQSFNNDERQCLINVLKAKNLDRFTYNSSEKYIYMPSNISETEFTEKYPHFAGHFENYRNDLLKRYSYGRQLPYWEFAFPRSKNLFETKCPKIFIPCKERISHKNYFRFCYSPEGFYPLQDVTAIVLKRNCKESIEYVLAYLNNERVFNWLKFNGIVKGEIVEFSETPIASIPFLSINWNNENEVSLHKKITEETSAYISDRNETHQKNINDFFNTLFNEKSEL